MQVWRYIFSGITLASMVTTAQAVSLSVSVAGVTGADVPLKITDTITNAGDYYSNTQTTESNASLLTIENLGASSVNWKVQARTDVSGLSISVHHTGSGSGDGTITNDLGYIPLTASYTTLFCGSGTGNRTDIPLQFQIGNLDVSDGYRPLALPVEYQIITTTSAQDTCN